MGKLDPGGLDKRGALNLTWLGWDEEFASAFASNAREGLVPARISRVDRGFATALSASGEVRISTPGRLPIDGGLAVGDWVAADTAQGALAAVLPRRTLLRRQASGDATRQQAVAANLTVVAIVFGLDVELRARKVERLMAVASSSGALAVALLTKADLAVDREAMLAMTAQATPGAPVIVVSAVTGEGIDAVRALVGPGQSLGLIGPSGVGKSTLVNLLAGAQLLDTAQTRSDGKGRHTTSHRQLVLLDNDGGVLIDTPGMRQAGVWAAEEGVGLAFDDLAELAVSCRFGDCSHNREPGCAILAAAVVDPSILDRLAGWRKLEEEQDSTSKLNQARALAEARRNLSRRQREADQTNP